MAIATGSTPLAGPARGLANRMTAKALQVISGTDAPRCCKRDSLFAILAAVRFAREQLGVDLPGRAPRCEWATTNRECIRDDCPFYPAPA